MGSLDDNDNTPPRHAEPAESGARLQAAVQAASVGLVGRQELAELVVLAAVAGEHLLIVGPPGTAKSAAVRRIASALGGQYFEYLLGRFTEPSELFGPIDLRALQAGRVVTETAGMLPEAEVAFLDEIFLGSTAILNTLLGLLNERRFRRGHTAMDCPLRVCVGASNSLPDEPALAAFADRFLLRVYVDNLPDPRLEELLEGGWQAEQGLLSPVASVADIDVLARQSRQMNLDGVRPLLADAVRTLRSAGVVLSDRRAVKVQRLIAAAATLSGRRQATAADLWPLIFAVPGAEEQAVARERLRKMLAESESSHLLAAAREASEGPAARAAALGLAARQLLDAPEDSDRWRLRLEGVARDLDAAFDPETLPPDLRATRAALLDALRSPPPPAPAPT